MKHTSIYLAAIALVGEAQAQLVAESSMSFSMAENFLQNGDDKFNGAGIGMMGKSGKGKSGSCSIESLDHAIFASYVDFYAETGYVASVPFTIAFNLPANNSGGGGRKLEGHGSVGMGVMEARACVPWYSSSLVVVQTGFVSDGKIPLHIVPKGMGDYSFFGEYHCNTGQMMLALTESGGAAFSTYPPMVRDDYLELDEGGCAGLPLSPRVHGKSGKGSKPLPLTPRLPIYTPWGRVTNELKTFLYPGRRLEVAAEKEADLNGLVAAKDALLPEVACDRLKEYIENLYEKEGFPPVGTLLKAGRNIIPKEDIPLSELYNVQLDGQQLIDLIGKDNANSLVGYFYEAMGSEVPITTIALQLAKHGEVGKSFTHHKDDEASLSVFLTENDDLFQGGALDYVMEGGHVTYPAKKGKAVVHGPNTMHGTKMWKGDRYVFYFKSDGLASSECMLKDLLE